MDRIVVQPLEQLAHCGPPCPLGGLGLDASRYEDSAEHRGRAREASRQQGHDALQPYHALVTEGEIDHGASAHRRGGPLLQTLELRVASEHPAAPVASGEAANGTVGLLEAPATQPRPTLSHIKQNKPLRLL